MENNKEDWMSRKIFLILIFLFIMTPIILRRCGGSRAQRFSRTEFTEQFTGRVFEIETWRVPDSSAPWLFRLVYEIDGDSRQRIDTYHRGNFRNDGYGAISFGRGGWGWEYFLPLYETPTLDFSQIDFSNQEIIVEMISDEFRITYRFTNEGAFYVISGRLNGQRVFSEIEHVGIMNEVLFLELLTMLEGSEPRLRNDILVDNRSRWEMWIPSMEGGTMTFFNFDGSNLAEALTDIFDLPVGYQDEDEVDILYTIFNEHWQAIEEIRTESTNAWHARNNEWHREGEDRVSREDVNIELAEIRAYHRERIQPIFETGLDELYHAYLASESNVSFEYAVLREIFTVIYEEAMGSAYGNN